jgi:sigma-B regulation protein RsbU (phosphoserine phosphatase)
MRILAVWDNEAETELISVYLGVEGDDVIMTTSPAEFREAIEAGPPVDIALMAIDLPDPESGFEQFKELRERHPEVPVVGACQPADVYRVVRFMAYGMSAYVTRDAAKNYLFMLRAIMTNTLDAVRAAREKELTQKLRQEVEAVRRLQESVLPQKLPAPPGYRISARYEPAQIRVIGGQPVIMAGGDHYDVFTLPNNNIVLMVGDATGHGMKSCMSIMTLHTVVRLMRRREFFDTAHFVDEINKGLCEQTIVTEKGGFITLLYCILNPAERTLQWSAAGHHPPLLQDLTTGSIQALAGQDAGGPPLAADEESDYETYTCQLPEQFRLLLHTDGLEEAFPEENDEHHFGLEGIIRTLAESVDQTLDELLARLFVASDEFTQGSGRQDDTSVILLERRA